ncbi:MAG: hypothetical protein ACI841_001973, partial [Planctomycetota bacterium]
EEAEDVALTLEGAGYTGPVDLRSVSIGIHAIQWSGQIPVTEADGPLLATVSFTAKGTGRFVLPLPESSGIRSFQTRVTLVDMPRLPIPASSLEPKSVHEDVHKGIAYTWSYANLVSERPIIIDLPAIQSPLARVLFMLRLVGLAILLFGLGFWYLVEGYEAGRLEDFRWRHFLLLGLTYSLFFAVFVVCGFQGVDTPTSLLISTAVSLPLLIWHTASIVDWKFAAKYSLPLVALTTGLVINGVYGGEWRNYVFLGAAAFVVAFLTFTMEGLVNKQNERSTQLEAELREQLQALEPLSHDLSQASTQAAALMTRRKDVSQEELRVQLTEDREVAGQLLDQYRGLDKRSLGMTQRVGLERREDRATIRTGLFGLRQALEQRVHRLEASNSSLTDLIEAADARAELRAEQTRIKMEQQQDHVLHDKVHCIACGHGWEGSRHCPECGVRRPSELTCESCETSLPLPVHLFDPNAEPQQLHCPTCGDRHAGASTDWFLTT